MHPRARPKIRHLMVATIGVALVLAVARTSPAGFLVILSTVPALAATAALGLRGPGHSVMREQPTFASLALIFFMILFCEYIIFILIFRFIDKYFPVYSL